MSRQDDGSIKCDLDLIGSNFSGDMIIYMRESLGLSLRGFAKFLDMEVTHQTISNWENEVCEPSRDTYEKCVQRYIEKRNKSKINPALTLLFNPLTVTYLKNLMGSLSKSERQAFVEKINDNSED